MEKIESENIGDIFEKEWKAEQLYIIEKMNHLLTYPYIIETGEFFYGVSDI